MNEIKSIETFGIFKEISSFEFHQRPRTPGGGERNFDRKRAWVLLNNRNTSSETEITGDLVSRGGSIICYGGEESRKGGEGHQGEREVLGKVGGDGNQGVEIHSLLLTRRREKRLERKGGPGKKKGGCND